MLKSRDSRAFPNTNSSRIIAVKIILAKQNYFLIKNLGFSSVRSEKKKQKLFSKVRGSEASEENFL